MLFNRKALIRCCVCASPRKLLAVCGSTHKESYLDIVMVAIVGALLALAAVIGFGTAFGSF